MLRRAVIGTSAIWLISLAVVLAQQQGAGDPQPAVRPPALPRPVVAGHRGSLFVTSENCLACHNGLFTASGENVSIGAAWRGSMMANASRDPYWQASVRREVLEHGAATAEIEDECSTCHMPMSHTAERATPGRHGQVFTHLPLREVRGELDLLAGDGVSCTACHQIRPEKLGSPDSFTGGFVIDPRTPFEERPVFGPYAVDRARTTIMHSASGFVPTEGRHIQSSALCATCHTLYTTARDANGRPIGRFPEQMPYLEWQHSAYRERQTCQACHMPVVAEDTPIASVLGEPRSGLSRHVFRGGNFFMLRMLNRYRDDLDVAALPAELEAEAVGTLAALREQTARVSVTRAAVRGGTLFADVTIENLTGHKLPTAYPSRRVWLHVTVRDAGGAIVFESGHLAPDGHIDGNDNDADASTFEPHHVEITRADQVQIYESILADPGGGVTTGLLNAVTYLKDNRLLPHGFEKSTATADIAVHGAASSDPDFTGGGDTVRYSLPVGTASGPFTITAELDYQPIAFRWARNLEAYNAAEPRRFTRYYRDMSGGSAAVLATSSTAVTQPGPDLAMPGR